MGCLEEQILQCLILDGRVPLRRVGEVVGVSEQTVARRYRTMRDEGRVRVTVGRSGFTRHRAAWTVRVRCRPDSATALATALAERDDTGWVALVSGGSEIVCTTTGPIESGGDGLLRRLPHTGAVLSFSAHALLRSFAGANDGWTIFDTPLDAATAATIAQRRAPRPASSGPEEPGEPDAPLLAALARDGRASTATLARELGWPSSRVAARTSALLGGGALYLATDRLPEAFGYHSSALLQLTVRPKRVVEVCRALAAHRPTGFVAATTGSTNVLAEVVCRTSDDLFRYATEQVGELPGVLQLDIAPYLRRVKEFGSRVVDGRLVGPR